MEMQVKARSGTPEEKLYAAKLIPIISDHHLLLVTLMLWNASATEALPIFLSALVPEYLAIIISVTLVLFVGEIIPASILTGPSQLKITAALSPIVYVVYVIFFPLAYPISYCLDILIGHEDGMTMYTRTEISTMMRLQREEGVKRLSKSTTGRKGNHSSAAASDVHLFDEEEVTIIDGALKFREMQVSEVMTPMASAFMISITETLSYKLIYEIFKSGYSRVPVFDRDESDIVGLILAKDLIFIDPEVGFKNQLVTVCVVCIREEL
jgi:metal transporter CNNM